MVKFNWMWSRTFACNQCKITRNKGQSCSEVCWFGKLCRSGIKSNFRFIVVYAWWSWGEGRRVVFFYFFYTKLFVFKSQLEGAKSLALKLSPLQNILDTARTAELECENAGVESNDYTILTVEDLEFDRELLNQAISKKRAFIENSVYKFSFPFSLF